MKVDTTMIISNTHLQDPQQIANHAKHMEEAGYAGAFAFEGQHDPFLPLAIAAQATRKIDIGTGIAVAFARNPMNLANLAYDLQLMSQGRFVLGLGTQIQPHIEKRFSMVWSKPAARMKEMIQGIRAIWHAWETGEKLDFEGEFYRHTLMTPTFSPGPNPFGTPKIFAAGVGPLMTESVCEVADGFTVHPFNTALSLREFTMPAVNKGIAKNCLPREQFSVSCNVIIATGANEEELAAARERVRKQIAFYGSTPAYRPVLECHGWGEVQTELNRLSKLGEWDAMSDVVSDAMLDAIAIVAPRESIAPRIREKYGGIADRINLVARYTNADDDWRDVVAALQA
jgi:probable F420-dependent oxidoreductase